MVNVDIRTRVELRNETQREKNKQGIAGKVALIGAFPSNKERVFAAESFAQIVEHYNISLNSKMEYWYSGVRAAKRLFMEGINGYAGASSVTCVNICRLTPKFVDEDIDITLYKDTYDESTTVYDLATQSTSVDNVAINSSDKYTITNDVIKNDVTLTFEKLETALKQIADEDMDILFIANDLWEIIDNPIGTRDEWKSDYLPYVWTNTTGYETYTSEIPLSYSANLEILPSGSQEGCTLRRIVLKDGTPVCVKDENGDVCFKQAVLDPSVTPLQNLTTKHGLLEGETVKDVYFKKNIKTIVKTEEGLYQIKTETLPELSTFYDDPASLKFIVLNKPSAPFINVSGGDTPTVSNSNLEDGQSFKKRRVVIKDGLPVMVKNADGSYGFKKAVVDPSANTNNLVNLTSSTGLGPGETVKDVFFKTKITRITGVSESGELTEQTFQLPEMANFYENPLSVPFMITRKNATETLYPWTILNDGLGSSIYGKTNARTIRNIGDIYDHILDFIDNEFTNHRPVNYMGAIKTRAEPEGNDIINTGQGVGSKFIRVHGTTYDYRAETSPYFKKIYTPSKSNPYANIIEWGAVDIANLFTRTSNELCTCGLFYQSGILAGEEVDAIELAAHICGWMCCLNIIQDLTYQTIPALTSVNEEPFFGESDAGKLLNEAGIQVIRPKSRLDKTFYINNSIMPTGWHTNHVRCVTYLLKRLQFESGLGINNIITNTEAYRATLQTTANEVLQECELIREVQVGDVEIINHYHIYVPISIVLAGVVTLINIGVGMALDETGTWGTYVKTTSGYSVNV